MREDGVFFPSFFSLPLFFFILLLAAIERALRQGLKGKGGGERGERGGSFFSSVYFFLVFVACCLSRQNESRHHKPPSGTLDNFFSYILIFIPLKFMDSEKHTLKQPINEEKGCIIITREGL